MEPTLNAALQYLEDEVRQRSQQIDQNAEALRSALRGLCDRESMALKRPIEFGGPAVSEADFRTFQEEVARVSGSLAFLQTQHQSAVSMLAKSGNLDLKQRYLPKMANGEKLVGIGFSQLRRPGPPMISARRVPDGHILDGAVPWITGWSMYPEFLVGATLTGGGDSLFAIVPFEDRDGDNGGYIRVSPPMRLAAMESAMTVSAEFKDWFVPDEDTAFIKPADWIKTNDLINIALQGHFALGCAQGGLDVLKFAAEKRGADFILSAHDKLASELAQCKTATAAAQEAVGDSDQAQPESVMQRRLLVRAWAIDLAVRCAHAAITASSGAANSLDHPAQRLYREALVYTVSAQTTPIMEATLLRLTR